MILIVYLIMSPEHSSIWNNNLGSGSIIIRKMTFHSQVLLLIVPDFYHPDYSKFWNLFKMKTNY